LRPDSADQFFTASSKTHTSMGASAEHSLSPRLPMGLSYGVGISIGSGLLFLVLWWILRNSGDRDSWLPAGLISAMFFLVATVTRKLTIRRIMRNYQRYDRNNPRRGGGSISSSIAELNLIERKLIKTDIPNASPNDHLDTYRLCEEYLGKVDETLRLVGIRTETRMALRNRQERVRLMQRRHLLAWARGASRLLTHEAQQLTKISDKIEKANNALSIIETARRIYPEENELAESSMAVSEYIASVRVGRWIELAERAAFKKQYSKAIDRYKDALFYLSRENVRDQIRTETIENIEREINLLKACIKNSSRKS
jgi:hypothetical protein